MKPKKTKENNEKGITLSVVDAIWKWERASSFSRSIKMQHGTCDLFYVFKRSIFVLRDSRLIYLFIYFE